MMRGKGERKQGKKNKETQARKRGERKESRKQLQKNAADFSLRREK
jgi:hypothetical protein